MPPCLQADSCDAVQELWFRSGDWFREALSAIQCCAKAAGCSAETAYHRLCAEPHLAKIWTRAFSKACLRARQESQESLLFQWGKYEKAVSAGWIFLRYQQEEGEDASFPCPQCQFSARSAAALASHQRAVHGVAARADLAAVGSKCEVCCKEFWSTKRLKLHLRKHPACLSATEAADLSPRPALRGAHSFAWPPAMPVHGPKPFWATLHPHPAPPPAPARHVRGLCWPVCPQVDKRSSTTGLTAYAKALLHFAMRVRPGDDDVPIALLDRSFGVADVTRCVISAARMILAQSAGSSAFRDWRFYVSGDRVIVMPTRVGWVEPLPAAWQVCLDSPS